MIILDKLSYSYPRKDLFDNVSLTIKNGQHCAFIGGSGIGKSTLVNIIMSPDKFMYDGVLTTNTSRKIGYVSQFSTEDKMSDVTVFDYIAQDHLSLQREISSICKEMETSLELDDLLEKYQFAFDAFESIGGDNFESNIHIKLNLADLLKHKDLKLSQLSGGEFKLIQVIKEMLLTPDIIIMDEVDAFLDFENLNALKNLINAHKGTLLIVTHNRYLLDHCFNKIIHLENEKIQEFDGKYFEYNVLLLKNKIEKQELALADDKEILRNELIIDHLRELATLNPEASRGKSLKARVKIQERLQNSRVKAPFVFIKQPEIYLALTNHMEDTLAIKVSDYSVSFDEVLLENVSFEINATDKVALIGANGTGKTTLLRDIVANKNPSIQIKEEVSFAYLSQIQGEILDDSNTILQEFFDIGFKTLEDICLYLSKYGVDEKDIRQNISSLSGGEKNILQWAKISHSKANMLLLDEPTSHLDTYSQIALNKAMKDYKGGILMISHDYYSIVNAMDYCLLIENKTIRKLSMRKFRKMIYAKYFDKDYLALDEKIKSTEFKIACSLKNGHFILANQQVEELEKLIQSNTF